MSYAKRWAFVPFGLFCCVYAAFLFTGNHWWGWIVAAGLALIVVPIWDYHRRNVRRRRRELGSCGG